MNLERVLAQRTFRRIAKRAEMIETTTSTNDHAWSKAANESADGYVVFAEHQTAGRGRMGRSWHVPRGAGIMCSLLLIDAPEHPVPEGGVLCIIAGIATAHAIRDATGLTARIDWPNDIIIRHGKVAGVLVESRIIGRSRRAYVVGIGINCLQHRHHFPEELRRRATSLDIETEGPVDREEVAGALLSRLDVWLADPSRWDPDSVCGAFRECSLPAGRRIRLRYQGRTYAGEVVDIDPAAALVVMLDDGTRTVFPASGTTLLHDPP
ncbi:MAG: biotin--[acetyl-CoA-carboxylase] ligase [Phycisphaerae bacterium]